jgi:hypothetical protein
MPNPDLYTPFDMPKQIAAGIWIVDAQPIRAGGMPLPVRMTILRLSSGDLLLHSPIQFSQELKHSIEELGPIRHLVAPSMGHWMFLPAWQQACLAAKTWAVRGLRERSQVRAAGIRIDEDLIDMPPQVWAEDLDQVLFQAPIFSEVDFFHRESRSLVLTDIVLNVEPETLPSMGRLVGGMLGILAPNGRAPLYVRSLLKLNRSQAAQAAARLISFAPERVIFTHGTWFRDGATEQLRRSLNWLL